MLFSRIEVNAELHCGFSALKRELQAYSGMHLVREGTILFYEIESDDDEHYYNAEFGMNKIALCIYARKTPMLFIREALLKLVALLQLTSGCYEVRLGSLYPYLVLALMGEQLISLQPNAVRQDSHAESVVLARKIVRLISENRDIGKSNTELASKLRKTILKTAALSGRGRINSRDFASELGIEEKDVIDALASAGDAGYKVAHYGNGNFGLVKYWQA